MARDMIEMENKNQELKHLGFMKVAAINTLSCALNLYGYAKQNSGPLISGVLTVEDTVTTVMGPACEKFKDVPNNLLVFLDDKVDEATAEFDEHAPPLAKQVVSQSWCMVQKATEMTKVLVSEARSNGPTGVVNNAATQYKQILSEQAVKAWLKLNQVPHVQAVAEMAVPTAAHWLDKYNQAVTGMMQKGYPVSFLPLVPIDKIAEVFNQGEATGNEGSEQSSEGADASVAHNTTMS
ncbi:hypothetical protein HHK36_025173 [Tetracentron sinense]|uniref:REF/SRPP-like protein n=1 Tax=Tetracentron sinense TaxID=13715 RepID=A0A835D5D5_TETSI|nr:hypothetical protein HHK36_025173 [Tetracentron sinense]